MRISFLSFLITNDEVNEYLTNDKNMPVQTHRFGGGFYNKLRKEGVDVVAIHSAPVSRFPSNRLFIRKPNQLSSGGYPFSFINLTPINFIERFIKSYYYLTQASNEIVIVHGLYLPYIAAAYFYSITHSAKLLVVLTDPINTGSGGITQLFRILNQKLINLFLTKFVASFTVSTPLSQKLMGIKPHLVVPGFFELKEVKKSKAESSSMLYIENTFKICYAGGLEHDYGIFELVKSVSNLCSTEVVLYICGKGPLEKDINHYATKFSNIKFLGYLSPEKLNDLYSKCDLLVNPRLPNVDSFKYSFPSKLFDYVSTTKPVLTTKLQSIPVEIEDCFYYFDDFTDEGMLQTILDLSLIESGELKSFGLFAFKKVVEYQESIKFKGFIESLAEDAINF